MIYAFYFYVSLVLLAGVMIALNTFRERSFRDRKLPDPVEAAKDKGLRQCDLIMGGKK